MDPDDLPDISHPSDPNPTPGFTEYLPIGEPAEGDILIPADGGGDDGDSSDWSSGTF